MTKRILAVALLITMVLGGVVTIRARRLDAQLAERQIQLNDARLQLAEANKKLAFLNTNKTRVQVTAYALTEDFGENPLFSNNTPARGAYAVPKHTLPAGTVINVALSPTAEKKLHAKLNDTLVLTTRHSERQYMARFVDRTAQTETRPVVDVLFADAHQARIWGRRSFYVANISRPGSPFREE
jgi:hypothetical protein